MQLVISGSRIMRHNSGCRKKMEALLNTVTLSKVSKLVLQSVTLQTYTLSVHMIQLGSTDHKMLQDFDRV